ncbi:hypothetical protein FRB99_007820 [Tulasnella sp. 403]|nr:hypothetical protein FRB99_007820 [Tulasnella sp. 403]
MVTTRGLRVNFKQIDEDEEGDSSNVEKPEKPTKRSKLSREDSLFVAGKRTSSKKGKTSTVTRNRRTGKLRDLMNMPVDIFAAICEYLSPKDLRNLTLTSRRLRSILMTREMMHIWRAARMNVVALPECPDDMSEPQYARLMFGAECYDCGGRATKTDFFSRARYCSNCYQDNTLRHTELPTGMGADLLDCISNRLVMSGTRIIRFKSKLYGHWWSKTLCDSLDSDMKVIRSIEDLEERVAALAETREKWTTFKRTRDETGISMAGWAAACKENRQEELHEIYAARQKSITDELCRLGFETEDIPYNDRDYRLLTRQPRPLTAQSWKSMEPKIVPIIQASRDARLAREKRNRESNRQRRLDSLYSDLVREIIGNNWRDGGSYINCSTFRSIPAIEALQENDTDGIPNDAWMEVVDEVREIITASHETVLQILLDMLVPGSGEQVMMASYDNASNGSDPAEIKNLDIRSRRIAAFKDKLSLATSAFWSWNHPIYPLAACPWNPVPGSNLVGLILNAAGMDPGTTTLEQITRMNADLICTRCDDRVTFHHTALHLVEHYVSARCWFVDATAAVALNREEQYPDVPADEPLPEILDHHDWSLTQPIVRRDDEDTKSMLQTKRQEYRDLIKYDPVEDEQGIGGDDFAQNYWRRYLQRTCKLCPMNFRPYGTSFGELKIHIQLQHGKAADLQSDVLVTPDRYQSTGPRRPVMS